ncbi:putative polysaccharide biosynthesis protein [Anaerosacchariphilus polymeriproducens]|uniref:Polysaccharide biosynthesis protein n=1 Tax=Anaerosacchariphilus polymeriproducens TaxID=1812858 RepID=A0A371AXI4_9FIRM|nr:polysaccharide biosynthesis protein [Anaerosacchariphilus polymeriproducens]RDU24283.1 polysaccharide biosynthesis protein [Anaerosacchariphilus polymeriproducens]
MNQKHTLLKGTFYLTLAGLISRIIGFFYRIFLSHKIGAEGLGIYHLIFPVFSLCFALTSAGIQTTISRFVAEQIALNNQKSARKFLITGIFFSICLSIGCFFALNNGSNWLGIHIIKESRCCILLKILAFAIPFEAIHACINGYYYGLKRAGIPALTQLFELIMRVTFVYLLFELPLSSNTPSLNIMVWGIVVGEGAAMLLSLTAFAFEQTRPKSKISKPPLSFRKCGSQLFTMSCPLTLNRVCLHLLQSVEAILIPMQLRAFGLNSSESLSIYGVLTGMALPLILFPSAFTNSISVMLLPSVAEAQAENQTRTIIKTAEKTVQYCLVLGILCSGIFLAFGKQMGNLIFNNSLAGTFIMILGWLCPFLYLCTAGHSILHGLGKMKTTFMLQISGILVRIGFVVFFIPAFGILGYLWGLLLSQLLITILTILFLTRYTHCTFLFSDWIVKPFLTCIFVTGICSLIGAIPHTLSAPLSSFLLSGINCTIFCLLYFGILYLLKAIPKFN